MGVPPVCGEDTVRLNCALVLGNRLRNVMSVLWTPCKETRLLMRDAANDWDQFYQITNARHNQTKHPTP